MPNWKKLIVSGSDASLNTLNIATALTASGLAYPDTDGSTGQILATDGSGGLYFRDAVQATGQNTRLTQTVAALTWSFQHDLSEKYPVIDVFDANDEMIIPQKIKAIDSSSLEIYFTSPRSGVAVATAGGLATSASYATTASYAVTASHAVNALTASYAISASHEISYEVSSSYAENATTASYILSTGVDGPFGMDSITSASYSVTSSYSENFNATGSITINGYTLPLQDGVDGQAIITDGDGTLTFDDIKVYTQVKNISGTTLLKGTPVHATSSAAPPSGNVSEVIAASASLATSMPATFVLDENLAAGAEGRAIAVGYIRGVSTSGFTVGDVVYVGPNGGYTNVKPTGSNLIQNLGVVTRVDASNGAGFIYGSGRSNDVPNIAQGYAWVGNQNLVATALPTSSFYVDNSHTASYSPDFTINGTSLTTQENTDVDTGTETVATVSTLTYDGAFFDYVVKGGTNYRAGTVMSVWDGSSIQYTDNSTLDIGDTSGVTLAVDISGTDARLRATVTSDNWNIKTFVRAL